MTVAAEAAEVNLNLDLRSKHIKSSYYSATLVDLTNSFN